MNIAKALRVTPIFLLTPIGRPWAELDIANLSSSFDGMTVVEFDAWISGAEHGAYHWSTNDERTERTERTQLQAFRELHAQLRERKRLTTNLEIERTLDARAGEIATAQEWDTTEERLAESTRRIAQLTSYLVSAGWDLDGWKD